MLCGGCWTRGAEGGAVIKKDVAVSGSQEAAGKGGEGVWEGREGRGVGGEASGIMGSR